MRVNEINLSTWRHKVRGAEVLRRCRPLVILCGLAFYSGCKDQPAKPKPKAGRWEGRPKVTFTVVKGELQGFRLEAPAGFGRQTCIVESGRITVDTNGGFVLGNPEKKKRTFVKGTFGSVSSIKGTYRIKSCKGRGDRYMVLLNPKVKPWSAKWVAP